MYLLCLDESGTHGGSPLFIVGGIALHEHDAWHMQRKLHGTLASMLPTRMRASDFELHAAEMMYPNRASRGRAKKSPWTKIPNAQRIRIMRAVYEAIVDYVCHDAQKPISLFGVVADRTHPDREQWAYEEVMHRFDSMLRRVGAAQGPVADKGLVIHDKRVIERDIQAWTAGWRHVAGRIGSLRNLAEVPVFADSRASRLLQAADFVTWALWRYYGLPNADDQWIEYIWDRFDAEGGVMHGLVHISIQFKDGSCLCPPCRSRRTAAEAIPTATPLPDPIHDLMDTVRDDSA